MRGRIVRSGSGDHCQIVQGRRPALPYSFVQAPFFFDDLTQASTKATPSTPSWTVGIDHVLGRLAALLARRADGAGRFCVDVGEAFEIAFRMAGRHARHARRGRAGAGAAAGDQLLRLRRTACTRDSSGRPAPIRARPWCRRRAASARSRGRAPPGSPRSCPCRRRRPGLKRSSTLRIVVERAARHEGVEVGGKLSSSRPETKRARL